MSKKTTGNNSTFKLKFSLGFSAGIVTIIFLLILNVFFTVFSGEVSNKHEHWGAFGDFIGGIMNPIISLATMCVVFLGVIYQREELKATRDELAESSKAHKLSADAAQAQLTHLEEEAQKRQLEQIIQSLDTDKPDPSTRSLKVSQTQKSITLHIHDAFPPPAGPLSAGKAPSSIKLSALNKHEYCTRLMLCSPEIQSLAAITYESEKVKENYAQRCKQNKELLKPLDIHLIRVFSYLHDYEKIEKVDPSILIPEELPHYLRHEYERIVLDHDNLFALGLLPEAKQNMPPGCLAVYNKHICTNAIHQAFQNHLAAHLGTKEPTEL